MATYQTNNIYTSQTTAFVTDLDENIHNTHVETDDVDGEMTTFYFDNPVTGSTDMVSFFEKFDVAPIVYLPNYSVGQKSFKDQVEIADLDELYEFILIEEE
tara:strand:- start:45 stop:347 length:303 start_codon:yes stop_codon:yes gene_type:complete